SPAPAIGPDTFSVRWTGQVQAVESGNYTVRTNSNDGVRLWVNGQLLIDHWQSHKASYDTATIALQAGQKYDIKLEYYENTGGALMQLELMRPGQGAFEVIPQLNLFS
ncbi:MAG TPA: PA14 domain-containing protein, partial [Gemmata sp.]|nr:PA14 domain-containing protein [Gemmata sp.]